MVLLKKMKVPSSKLGSQSQNIWEINVLAGKVIKIGPLPDYPQTTVD